MKLSKLTLMAGGLAALAATPALADGPNWSGPYISGGAGYGLWTADTTTVNQTTGAPVLAVTQTQGGRGTFGTIGLGFDRRFDKNYLAGVFVDTDFGALTGTIQDQGPFFAGRIKKDGNVAIGARAGLLISPQALAYLTAGYSRAHFSGTDMVNTFNGASSGFSTSAFSRGGLFVGGGYETQLKPGWFLKSEYRLAHYGSHTIDDTNGAGGAQASITFKPTEQSVRTSLVYRFNADRGAEVQGSLKDAPSAGPRVDARWNGPYVSGSVGYGLWAADTTTRDQTTGAGILNIVQTQGGKGLFGAIGAGYDRRVLKDYVAGVFVDGDFGGLTGTIQDQGPFFAGRIKLDRNFALGARAGYLVSPDVLTFGTIGYTRAHFASADMVTTFAGAPTGFSTQDFSKAGWFGGGGLEAALKSGWSWKTEYRASYYGTQNVTDATAGGATASITFKPIEQTIRTGLAYKFNWN